MAQDNLKLSTIFILKHLDLKSVCGPYLYKSLPLHFLHGSKIFVKSFQKNWLLNRSLIAQAFEFLSKNYEIYPPYIILHQNGPLFDKERNLRMTIQCLTLSIQC